MMKKLLTILLSVFMIATSFTVNVFAEGYDVQINDVPVTSEGVVNNDAITRGTITFTAPTATTPAKLTLNNAKIETDGNNKYGITAYDCDIVIELIGDNEIVNIGQYCIYADENCTINGYGSLSLISNNGNPLECGKNLLLDMRGALSTTGKSFAEYSGNYAMYVYGDFKMAPEAGKVIMHGKDIRFGAFVLNKVDSVFSGYDWVIGSTNMDETNEANMVPVTRKLDEFFIDEAHPQTLVFITAEAKIGETKYKTVQEAVNAANTGDTVVLLKDVTLENTLDLTNKSITLDLDGHVLNRGLINIDGTFTQITNNSSVIKVEENGNLSLIDSNTDNRLHKFIKITDGTNKGLFVLDENFGTEIITGGCITGGSTSGIEVNNGGVFTMESGTVVGNCHTGNGAGIFVNDNSTFVLNNGVICNNTTTYGGGVATFGIFEMNDGKICNNIVQNDGASVMVGGGTMTMLGGEISGNICGGIGGAIDYWQGNITLGGTAKIIGNFKVNGNTQTANNLYLEGDNKISLAGDSNVPTNGMLVGVTTETPPTSMVPAIFSLENANSRYVNYFFSDNEDYEVRCNTSNSLELAITTKHVTFNINGHGNAPENKEVTYNRTVERPSDPTATGFLFGGWYKDTACTQAWNFDKDTVTKDITLYAKWIPNGVDSATISGNVTEQEVGNVPNATVELYLGTVKVAATTTNTSGQYSFSNVEKGTYNIVVTKIDGKTKTELVEIDTAGTKIINVVLPASSVNSKVEHTGEKVANTKSDIKQAVVGGLDKIAEEQTPSGSDKITIKLKVEPKKEEDVDNARATEIKQKAGNGKKVEFIDMSLFRQVNNSPEESIGSDNNKLLTIIIPFDFTNTNVDSVMILRKHGANNAEILPKDPAPGNEGYVINREAGTITVYAMKFSDYAIAYTNTGSNPPYNPTHRYTVPNTGIK